MSCLFYAGDARYIVLDNEEGNKRLINIYVRSLLRILPRGRELAKIHIGEAANPLQMTIHWSNGSSWITVVVQIVFEIHLRIEACDS